MCFSHFSMPLTLSLSPQTLPWMGALRLTTLTAHLTLAWEGYHRDGAALPSTDLPYFGERVCKGKNFDCLSLPRSPPETRSTAIPAAGRALCHTFRISWLPQHQTKIAPTSPSQKQVIFASPGLWYVSSFIRRTTSFGPPLLPLDCVNDNVELSHTASVADRPDVNKFRARSTATDVALDTRVSLGGVCRKVRAHSHPSSSRYQTWGVNMEEQHKLYHMWERKLHMASSTVWPQRHSQRHKPEPSSSAAFQARPPHVRDLRLPVPATMK